MRTGGEYYVFGIEGGQRQLELPKRLNNGRLASCFTPEFFDRHPVILAAKDI